MSVYTGVLGYMYPPEDRRFMGLLLTHGGHLTHGFQSKFIKFIIKILN